MDISIDNRINGIAKPNINYSKESELVRMQDKFDLLGLEKTIGYRFNNKELAHIAFTHPIFTDLYGIDERFNYHRLEFLGDAVMDFMVADYMLLKYRHKDRYFFNKLLNKVVSNRNIALNAERLGLRKFIIVSDNLDCGSLQINFGVLADVFESVIGALYVDGGEYKARKFIINNLEDGIANSYKETELELQEYDSYGKVQGLLSTFADSNNQIKRTNTVHKIEKIIGYKFKNNRIVTNVIQNLGFLNNGMIYMNPFAANVSFLGNKIVKLAVVDYIYKMNPNGANLTKLVEMIINNRSAHQYLSASGIREIILPIEGKIGLKENLRISTRIYKTIVGAIYIDGGLSLAQEFVKKSLNDIIQDAEDFPLNNYKDDLSKYLYKKEIGIPYYEIFREENVLNKKMFTVAVKLSEGKILAEGKGYSFREASQDAAKNAMGNL